MVEAYHGNHIEFLSHLHQFDHLLLEVVGPHVADVGVGQGQQLPYFPVDFRIGVNLSVVLVQHACIAVALFVSIIYITKLM